MDKIIKDIKVIVSTDEYCYQLGDIFYMSDVCYRHAQRYLMVFDAVRMVLRTKKVFNESALDKNLIKITDPRVEVWPVKFFQGPMEFAKNYFSIKKELKGICEDCQIGFLRLPSTIAFSAWKEIKKNKIPYATELIFDCYDAYKSEYNPILKFIWWIMHQKQIHVCKQSIGIAPVTQYYLQKHYMPIDDNVLKSHYSTIELTEDFFYQPRKYPRNKSVLELIHIAHPIQFNGRKGHNDLIKVLKILKDVGLIVNITFVGGDYFGGIAKLKDLAVELGVDNQVTFAGFLNKQEIKDLLINSDIAILPTKAEGLPRVVIEAMAVGLPCITTDVSGNPELINENMLFKYGDCDAIAQKIIMLVKDKTLYESESECNFRKSQEYEKSILDARRRKFYTALKNRIINNK